LQNVKVFCLNAINKKRAAGGNNCMKNKTENLWGRFKNCPPRAGFI